MMINIIPSRGTDTDPRAHDRRYAPKSGDQRRYPGGILAGGAAAAVEQQ
jgi:hypothetical protein